MHCLAYSIEAGWAAMIVGPTASFRYQGKPADYLLTRTESILGLWARISAI
jgi:hypothetical protein